MKTFASLALVLPLLAGCTLIESRPDPSRFYVLDAPAPERPSVPAAGVAGARAAAWAFPLAVARVQVPSYLDQSHVVSRTGGSRVTFSEFNRWLEPVDKGATRVFSNSLAERLGATKLAQEPSLDVYRDGVLVQVNALRFDGELGGEVLLHARWRASAVHDGSTLMTGEREERVRCEGGDYQDYAAAMGVAIDRLAADVAGELRTGVVRNAAGLPVAAPAK